MPAGLRCESQVVKATSILLSTTGARIQCRRTGLLVVLNGVEFC